MVGEALSTAGVVGIGITVVGTVLASIRGKAEKPSFTAGVPWALGAALGYGVSFWAQGHFLVPRFGGLGSLWLFFAFGVMALLLLASIARRTSIVLPPPPAAMAVTFGGGLLAIGRYVCIALGFATGHVAIVAVLSTLSSVVTALFGYTLLNERLATFQWLGAALIVIGVGVLHAG
jgi:drug/metabolite transporter (DMT)-like permease